LSVPAVPDEISLFPLHTVLFPGGLLPLRVFEPRYMEMVSACLRGNEPFGVCLIREGREVGAPAVPHSVGCLARIAQWDMQQLGVLNIVARGERRFRIVERSVQPDGLCTRPDRVARRRRERSGVGRIGSRRATASGHPQ
jgi:Lon protease-like protein